VQDCDTLREMIKRRRGATRTVASRLRLMAAAVRHAWIAIFGRPRCMARASHAGAWVHRGSPLSASDGVDRAVDPACSITRDGDGLGGMQNHRPFDGQAGHPKKIRKDKALPPRAGIAKGAGDHMEHTEPLTCPPRKLAECGKPTTVICTACASGFVRRS